MTSCNASKGDVVRVVYVAKRDAKRVKTHLEQAGLIQKDYRMTPSSGDLIAIPVLQNCTKVDVYDTFGFGEEFCPYSTSLLANQRHRKPGADRNDKTGDLFLSQRALWNVVTHELKLASTTTHQDSSILDRILSFPLSVCPKNLEFLGDDRILVIPQRALNPMANEEFATWLDDILDQQDQQHSLFLTKLWKELADLAKTPKIVRRGEVDPDSGVRQSGYEILWPLSSSSLSSSEQPLTGPGSPGWITVTEQGIRQSFDLSLVMFSRGNISEKIRFGRLVQEGEVLLDMYAGIGYFTLPALVKGRAAHVYACEWNPNAIEALRYNLKDNGVENRATVLEGDCRVSAREYAGMVDRVSLGLIPSSEGGWPTAVRALKRNAGGWLHVHGNVPSSEVDDWSRWMCLRMQQYARKRPDGKEWVVLLSHVEKVKSFAPMVNHYVADVWMGPVERANDLWKGVDLLPGSAVVRSKDGSIDDCPSSMDPPSCALSPDGVLHQAWMRDESST